MSRFVSGRDDKDSNNLLRTDGAAATGAISSPPPTVGSHLSTLQHANTLIATIPAAGNSLQDSYLAGYDGTGCAGLWTVPSGVSNIFVQIWGGGAGGAMNCTWRAGAPGGGGGYSHRSIAVTAGQQFCYCAGGGARGGCAYPGAKRSCPGCNSRFCGPTAGGTVCMVSCGGTSASCWGTWGGDASCGGLASGGDINVPGGWGIQTSCCSCRVNKQCGPGSFCHTPVLLAGGSFLGAPNLQSHPCICISPCRGLPFGGGGIGGVSGMYSGGCSCGTSGGPGAVIIWY